MAMNQAWIGHGHCHPEHTAVRQPARKTQKQEETSWKREVTAGMGQG